MPKKKSKKEESKSVQDDFTSDLIKSLNKDAWNKLDAETQKLVMNEATLAERKGWDLSKKGNVADKKALSDAGMEVGKVNSALQKHFQKVGAKMADEWKAKAGARGVSVLAAYK